MGDLKITLDSTTLNGWYHPTTSYVDRTYVDNQVISISDIIKQHGHEKILDEMDIEKIEEYVRNKKLKRITSNIKNK